MPKFSYPLPDGGECIIRELTLDQKEGFGVAALNLAKGNTTKAAVVEERLSLQSCLVQFGDHKFANAIETEAAWENRTLTLRDKQFIQMAYADNHEVTVAQAVAFLASKEPDPDNQGCFRFLFPDWSKHTTPLASVDVPEGATEEEIDAYRAQVMEEAKKNAKAENWLVMRLLGVQEAEQIADRLTKGNVYSAVMEEERRLIQAATVSIKGVEIPKDDWKFVKVRQRRLISIAYAVLHTVTSTEEASFFAGRKELP